MTTYYVRDRRTGEIVNATDVDYGPAPTITADRWIDAEYLYYDANPPLEVLKRYRYWDERP